MEDPIKLDHFPDVSFLLQGMSALIVCRFHLSVDILFHFCSSLLFYPSQPLFQTISSLSPLLFQASDQAVLNSFLQLCSGLVLGDSLKLLSFFTLLLFFHLSVSFLILTL